MRKKIRIIVVAGVIAAVGGIAIAARDAKDEHLERCRCFTDDQDAIRIAVQVRAIRLSADRVPVESPNQGTRSGHYAQTTISPRTAQPRDQRRGGRHANR